MTSDMERKTWNLNFGCKSLENLVHGSWNMEPGSVRCADQLLMIAAKGRQARMGISFYTHANSQVHNPVGAGRFLVRCAALGSLKCLQKRRSAKLVGKRLAMSAGKEGDFALHASCADKLTDS